MKKKLFNIDENFFKKFALFNAELISLGADKVKEVADEFVKKGIFNDNDAKKFVSEVREKLTAKQKEFEEKIEKVGKAASEILSEFGIGTGKDEAEKLDSKISALEKELEELKTRKEALKKSSQKSEVKTPAK